MIKRIKWFNLGVLVLMIGVSISLLNDLFTLATSRSCLTIWGTLLFVLKLGLVNIATNYLKLEMGE